MSTIAAISTPYGKGGVAVIRISGENALETAQRCFVPGYKKSLMDFPARHAVYGSIISNGREIDHGIATLFRAPNSFTGEDMAEISCHGGVQITAMVLEAVLSCGAVMAQPGEFTKRAFINGKMTLTQAEAVAELLDAKSETAALLSASQLDGRLSARINCLHDKLVGLVSTLYAAIDYPEEDLEDMSDQTLQDNIRQLISETSAFADSYRTGLAVTGGVDTAILGRPNAGKSSLFNALAGQNRAIVTSAPGTTRDMVDISIKLEGIILNLRDTAGIRDTQDEAEKIGVEMSLEQIQKSQLILAVLDGTKKPDQQDMQLIKRITDSGRQAIAVISKCDLDGFKMPELPLETVAVSAVTGEGLDNLKRRILDLYGAGDINLSDGGLITNARQYGSVIATRDGLREALDVLQTGQKDMCGMLLERALASLDSLDGRGVSQEIVQQIFSRFCVGK